MIVKNYKNHLILSSKTIRNSIIKLGKLNQKFISDFFSRLILIKVLRFLFFLYLMSVPIILAPRDDNFAATLFPI